MKAAVQVGHGTIDQAIRIQEVPAPSPGAGEALVRVRSATLNRKDLFALRDVRGPGLRPRPPLPHVNGADLVGEIAALGPGVSGWAEGEMVTAYSGLSCDACEYCLMGEQTACIQYGAFGEQVWGSHAEYATVRARNLERVPAGVDLGQVACAGGAWTTAWRMLVTVAKAAPGETVLIVGASGGVGSGGIQIARLAGCRVIAVVGGEWKVRRALELGADHAIDHTREDFQLRCIFDGRLVPVVHARLPLDGIHAGLKMLEARDFFGQIVIQPT